ncbi:MAG: hypothetical protein KKF30_08385 [Proteobacteria bacterium]|nr:hypothetical protein [Pseudomonadota bacterium]MBU4471793.1 hypothetical protein [Pseudomonadota bacterium]MCG2750574.1 hypothetical protein [Desulfobacteraceae bacterium]
MKKENQDLENSEVIDPFRRRFLKGCGITALTTASYCIISILSGKTDARADMCSAGCVSACVDSCTGCTTVNCTSGNVPDPSPPECVQDF